MAHCISLDETIPKKSIDVATNNVTHIHYGNSSEQYNNSQVGCYQNAEQYEAHEVFGAGSMILRHNERCPNCGNSSASIYYFPTTPQSRAGYYDGYCGTQYNYSTGNEDINYFYRTITRTHYKCPYTAGTTVMSIGVMHMDKVGARRTLTINFDDQITNAGSVISYAWNTGATTQSITVNQRGTYYCDVTWRETQSQVNHTVRLTYTF